jgi:hypothetical protein
MRGSLLPPKGTDAVVFAAIQHLVLSAASAPACR